MATKHKTARQRELAMAKVRREAMDAASSRLRDSKSAASVLTEDVRKQNAHVGCKRKLQAQAQNELRQVRSKVQELQQELNAGGGVSDMD